MKLHISATTPFLAKFAFSIPAFVPPAIPQTDDTALTTPPIITQTVDTSSSALDCTNVWNKVCSGTNSNGDAIYGSFTCGARVQYVHDYKLGRSPSLSAAIDQVLSECPTQCLELADDQCETFAQNNLQVPDCSTTWDNVCSGVNSRRRRIYGSWTCGERVKYVHNVRPATKNLEQSVASVYYQCRDKCENINSAQCANFVEGKLNEVDDDYEAVDSVQATATLGTCQEAFDRTCTDFWGSWTCGERVSYVYNNKLGDNPVLTDAINKVNGECPTHCREFQNGNCDTFISNNIDAETSSSSNE